MMEDNSLEQKKVPCSISEPSLEFQDSYLAVIKEFQEKGQPLDESISDPGPDFAAFVKNLKDESLAIDLKPGRVPQTTYWITDEDGYAGRISIRHELTEKLLAIGGHIGYGVIPSKRGKGYATKAFQLVLPKARALGLEKVLLTCLSSNTASKRIIESNGGILENEVPTTDGKSSRLRYWIKL
jgi:predicted acetyltransferase